MIEQAQHALQVVLPGWGRLRHHQCQVASRDAGVDRATDARRAVHENQVDAVPLGDAASFLANLGNQLAGVVLGYAERGVDQGPKGGSPLHPHAGLVVDEGYGLHGTDQGTDTASLAGKRIHEGKMLDSDRGGATLLSTQSAERAALGIDPRAATRPEPLGPDVRAR